MDIINYPNYLIYEDGRVFSKKRNIFLKYSLNDKGYKQVGLSNNGKQKTHTIHKLVAIHYIPNPKNYNEIDHFNRNKNDNNVENLRWCSRSENVRNRNISKNNTSGYKNIYYRENRNIWSVKYYKICSKSFKTKKEALCYKFIVILKIKSKSL